jgi:hypothetical protein
MNPEERRLECLRMAVEIIKTGTREDDVRMASRAALAIAQQLEQYVVKGVLPKEEAPA